MNTDIQEKWAARAILYVAKGICSVEFPTSNAGGPSRTVRVVRSAPKGSRVEMLVPVVFNGDLWVHIAEELPSLTATPYRDLDRDLLPLAIGILRRAVEKWGTPTLEESPENPAGRRTPGWAAEFDPFDP